MILVRENRHARAKIGHGANVREAVVAAEVAVRVARDFREQRACWISRARAAVGDEPAQPCSQPGQIRVPRDHGFAQYREKASQDRNERELELRRVTARDVRRRGAGAAAKRPKELAL